ncbi:MAG: tetratricopeptide repeat protein, partial [Limisphaerales bacterium]
MSQPWFAKIIFLLIFGAARMLWADSVTETNAFQTAAKIFNDQLFKTAEGSFAEFLATYPGSEHRAEAILFQAQARFHQTNSAGALELLQKELPKAGTLAEQYQFWIAESFFQNENYEAAAQAHAELLKKYPRSARGLEASYNQALAYARLKNWDKVVELLRAADGSFQKFATIQPDNPFAQQGLLLLAEALIAQKKFAESERVLKQLDEYALDPIVQWRQQFLWSRAQLEAGHLEAALQISTNALQVAAAIPQKSFSAQTILLQGEILEKLNRLPEAAQVQAKLLATNLRQAPAELRRQALFKVITLTLAQKKTAEARQRLESFIKQNPRDPTLDLARLTLGELQLKEYFAGWEKKGTNRLTPTLTNGVQLALTNFNKVIAEFPESPLLGKAWLLRGWCFWRDQKNAEAKASFAQA